MTRIGRKGVYTEEIKDTIVSVIASEGTDQAGFEAGGISKATFYAWIKSNPDFQDAIHGARKEFKQTCDSRLKRLARGRLREYLEQGQIITREKTEVEEHRNEHNQVFLTINRTGIHTERRATPAWVINKILASPVGDLNQAIAMVQSAGFQVIDPTLPLEREQQAQGLTPEAAAIIKAQLLGISEEDEAEIDSSKYEG